MSTRTHALTSPITVFLLFLPLLLLSLLIASPAYGANYQIGYAIGDGSGGRVFRKWTQAIENRQVEYVEVRLRKVKGGNDAYVNLRFEGSQTFENGKRVYLKDAATKWHKWNVNGASPNGKPLVMNAYKGEVFIESAKVIFRGQARRPKPVPRPPVRPGGSLAPSTHDSNISSTDNPGALARCRNADIRRPRIEIGRVKASGGLFSGKYNVEGSVRGMCIEEAGYFENGRLKENIPFGLNDRFQRREFSFKARTGRRGEIRVYTSDGQEDIIAIDDEIKAQGLL